MGKNKQHSAYGIKGTTKYNQKVFYDNRLCMFIVHEKESFPNFIHYTIPPNYCKYFLQKGVSYIDSSRGLRLRCRRKNVHNSRACDCIRHVSECGLWINLLDHNFILTKKACRSTSLFILISLTQ